MDRQHFSVQTLCALMGYVPVKPIVHWLRLTYRVLRLSLTSFSWMCIAFTPLKRWHVAKWLIINQEPHVLCIRTGSVVLLTTPNPQLLNTPSPSQSSFCALVAFQGAPFFVVIQASHVYLFCDFAILPCCQHTKGRETWKIYTVLRCFGLKMKRRAAHRLWATEGVTGSPRCKARRKCGENWGGWWSVNVSATERQQGTSKFGIKVVAFYS